MRNFKQNPLFLALIILAFFQLMGGGGKLSLLLEEPALFVILIISLLLAITVHEFCHALAADRLGDPTPRLDGRITLNPTKHLDPIGTIMIIFTNFGWGRPVQFDPYNLRAPKKDGAIIAVCGPLSNLLMALLCSLGIKLLTGMAVTPAWYDFLSWVVIFLYTFGTLNISLAVFNLIPIKPLDGSHIIRLFFSGDALRSWDKIMNRYGTIFLLLFIFPLFGQMAPINYVISPIIDFLSNLLF